MTRIMGPQVEELALGCSKERVRLCSRGLLNCKRQEPAPATQ